MASGKEIRNKIKSVQNTKKITKAMEMVAASKMRKAQDRPCLASSGGNHLVPSNTCGVRRPFLALGN